MKDINDQPQELLARYADRVGAKIEFQPFDGDWEGYNDGGPPHESAQAHLEDHKIRLVLDPVTRLPSHLKPYKENPRDPGDGWRSPVIGDPFGGIAQVGAWHEESWTELDADKKKFQGHEVNDYRLPATVMPPDWEEMTKEEAQADPNPWIPHTGDEMPCDGERLVDLKLADRRTLFKVLPVVMSWVDKGSGAITHWRYADVEPERSPFVGKDFVVKDLLKEIEDLKERNSQLEEEVRCAGSPTLRPVSEMPTNVPEGCVRYWCKVSREGIIMNSLSNYRGGIDTHEVDIRLPVKTDPLAEERVKFEDKFPNLVKSLMPSGMYGNQNTQYVWEGWLAAKGL